MEKMQSNSRSNSNLRILPQASWLVRWRKLGEMAGLWLSLAVQRYIRTFSYSVAYYSIVCTCMCISDLYRVNTTCLLYRVLLYMSKCILHSVRCMKWSCPPTIWLVVIPII